MNKQLQDAQARVERITAALEEKLGLGAWWEIKHIYVETPAGATEIDPTSPTGTAERTTACTVSRWQYRMCEVTWYLPSVATKDDVEIKRTAVHEYVHMLNAPLAAFLFDYLRDDEPAVEAIRTLGHYGRLEEYVTESVARIILKAIGDSDVPG